MVKRHLSIIGISSLLSLGIAFPLCAQIEEPPAVLDEEELDAIGVDDLTPNDDVGLPEGGSPPDAGLPDAGQVIPQDLIRIDINGEPGYYTPVDIDEADLDGARVPTYILDGDTGALEDADVLENDDSDLIENDADVLNNDDDNDGLIIYPPADSIEDLEPEDILE